MNKLILTGCLAITLIIPVLTEAAKLSVRPFLIDHTAEPRGFIEDDIVLKNEANHKINVYATVNEISIGADGEIKQFVSPVMTDRRNTITSWIEISRARIEINQGESTTVPLKFRIHPNAEPGEYHAFIGFGAGSKRPPIEAAAMRGELDGVIAKITIEDQRTEYVRISAFKIDRFVTGEGDKEIEIELENLGDVDATPKGEIIIYSSKGEELQAIPVNTENVTVSPGETTKIITELPFTSELGRYKANLSLQYGAKQKASLYDTTQFFLMPVHMLLIMLVIAIGIGILIFLLLHRALSYKDDDSDEQDLPLVVRDGRNVEPKDHDIDLSNKN